MKLKYVFIHLFFDLNIFVTTCNAKLLVLGYWILNQTESESNCKLKTMIE